MSDTSSTNNGVDANGGVSPGGSGSGVMGLPTPIPATPANTQSIADYLAQLLKDKKQLAAFPNVFLHVERLLDDGKAIFKNKKESFFSLIY